MTPNDKKFVAFVATVVLIFTVALVVKEVARINPIDQEVPEQFELFKQAPKDKNQENNSEFNKAQFYTVKGA